MRHAVHGNITTGIKEPCAVSPQRHDTTFSGLLGNSFAKSIKHESEGRDAH